MDKESIKKIIEESNDFITTVVKKKYCINNELTYDDVITRFKNGLEKDFQTNVLRKEYKDIKDIIPTRMKQKKFIPAGSVLYGYKNNLKSSLSNCYYIPIEKDSIEGIYTFLQNTARTYSWRGGVGTDISILRPRATKVNNSAITSSGAVSFMPLMSESTNTIGQNGRRGASIITISDWHPSVLDFIRCKSEPEKVFDFDYINKHLPKVHYANISVKLSKLFFECAEKDEDWKFVFPDIEKDKDFYNKNWNGDIQEWIQKGGSIKIHGSIKAREMLKLISEKAWLSAEPGVLYWNNVLDSTPLAKIPEGKPRGVNPCGEQILPNWGNCLLSAVVLYKYVIDPFTTSAKLDLYNLLQDLKYYQYFLDYLIDINKHPLKEQNDTDRLLRKIGLEFTGFADMLAMLNIEYGSEESLKFTEDLFSHINKQMVDNNIEMAKVIGPAPILQSVENRKLLADSNFIKTNNNDKVNDIITYGLRNSAWTTIGPCGTISIVSDNCSSGIEPVFQLVYKRNSRLIGKETRIIHLPLLNWIKEHSPDDIDLPIDKLKAKYHYVEASDLDFKKRIKMQSTIQKYITDSISSTLNLPESTTEKEILEIYKQGSKDNLKGVTVFRTGSLTGILTDIKDNSKANKVEIPLERQSYTFTMFWKKFKTYVTVAHHDKKPVEIFVNLPPEAAYDSKNVRSEILYKERQSTWSLATRLISLCLRYNIPIKDILKQIRKCVTSINDLPSIIYKCLIKTDYKLSNQTDKLKGVKCPICGKETLEKKNGCDVCTECGYSKCD